MSVLEKKLCQRPKRASFISTRNHLRKLRMAPECVNALNGLLSFLLMNNEELKTLEEGCQRPKRASFISTVDIHDRMKSLTRCQRPKRASFISTIYYDYGKFYISLWCQRPKRASFISTSLKIMKMKFVYLCQRPKRASFISTDGTE